MRGRTKEQAKEARRLLKLPPGQLEELDLSEFHDKPRGLERAWKNNRISVQLYRDPRCAYWRLSVARHDASGPEFTWDQLQRVKNQCLGEGIVAVEIYPAAGDVVNVANMRHLWILHDPEGRYADEASTPEYGWRLKNA